MLSYSAVAGTRRAGWQVACPRVVGQPLWQVL